MPGIKFKFADYHERQYFGKVNTGKALQWSSE
jgi:hypothetical protein